MGFESHPFADGPRGRTFDVIAAGEALWNLASEGARMGTEQSSLPFRPGGGALSAAVVLARQGLRVGLVTSLADDSFGRALVNKVASAGVDTSGVTLAAQQSELVFVERTAGARQVVSYRTSDEPLEMPEGWTSKVLLLSGLSPVISQAAAFCRAARAARRSGTIVVIEVNARSHLWKGRDDRTVRSILKEADVVRCTIEDLWVLGVDPDTLRTALRPNAVLVVSNASTAWATGPFGELLPSLGRSAPIRSGHTVTASICAELVRSGSAEEARVELWQRALSMT